MPTCQTVFQIQAIDLRQLAHAGHALSGQTLLADLPRWQDGAPAWQGEAGAEPLALVWQAWAEARTPPGGQEQVWLRLAFTAQVPQVCQRCLGVYLEPVEVDRWFRFVVDEATAEAQDDAADEDLLVWSPRFNLQELVEDELLLALPLVPMHPVCPQTAPARLEGAERESVRPNPFAALSSLTRSAPGTGPDQAGRQ